MGQINGTMSGEMESYLNRITSKENVLLGVHRLREGTALEDIQDILFTGLEMTGNSSFGMVQGEISLRDNVSYCEDNKEIIKELMYDNLYENSPGYFN